MGKGYNPYRRSDGRFGSGHGKRRIQYASSDERDDIDDDDVVSNNEDLKDSQIEKAAAEAKRLEAEEAQKERDKRISEIRSEISHYKEKIAGAYDMDSRHTYQRLLKSREAYLKKLLGGQD